MPKAKPTRFTAALIPIDSQGGLLKQKYSLGEKTILGRSIKSDVRVDSIKVSREHAVVYASGEEYLIEHRSDDLNPTLIIRRDFDNPLLPATTLELKERGSKVALREGDIISLAPRVSFKLVVEDIEPATEPNLRHWQTKAVVNADIEGYSRLVAENAEETRRQLEDCYLQIFVAEYPRYHCDFIERVGDGVLAVFSSVTDAVAYSKSVQRSLSEFNRHLPLTRQMHFRIGICCGDILINPAGKPGEMVYGDAINLAERIQRVAAPGGVSISGPAYELLPKSERGDFKRGDMLRLANIGLAVETYRLTQ
jgi:class 3 adenylate cyclase